jgi:hypothetical protein
MLADEQVTLVFDQVVAQWAPLCRAQLLSVQPLVGWQPIVDEFDNATLIVDVVAGQDFIL